MSRILSKQLTKNILPNGNTLITYSKDGKKICAAIIKKAGGGRQIVKVNDFNEISRITDVANHKRQILVPTKEEVSALKALLGIV